MKKRLFICERPYPLYRTLIKCINDSQNNDILISNHVEGMEKMYPILKDTNIFKHVFFFDDIMYKKFYSYGKEYEFRKFPKGIFILFRKLRMYIELQKKAENIKLPNGLDIETYDEIYVNDAVSTIMLHLCSKKKKMIWVEHAKNVFSNDFCQLPIIHWICFKVLSILEKLGITYALHGASKWVKAVEVNKNRNLISLIRKKEIREVDIDQLLKNISKKDKDYIFELYCKAYHVELDKEKPFYIILTAPLYFDNLVSSEKEQIKVYKNLIEREIRTYTNVLIKPHPRDEVEYKKMIPEVTVIESCFSAEVFNLSSKLQLEGVYGIRTSTINAFTNAKIRKSYSVDQIKDFL